MYWFKKAPLVSGIDFLITGTIVLNWLARNTLQCVCASVCIFSHVYVTDNMTNFS